MQILFLKKSLCSAAKTALRGKLTPLSAYIRRDDLKWLIYNLEKLKPKLRNKIMKRDNHVHVSEDFILR